MIQFTQKQDALKATLASFEREGIESLTNYKNTLIENDRENFRKADIEKLHGDLLKRWNDLLKLAEAKKNRLDNFEKSYKEIEDLFLQFAKKASAFNSWFENAEEDLTDSVSLSLFNINLKLSPVLGTVQYGRGNPVFDR